MQVMVHVHTRDGECDFHEIEAQSGPDARKQVAEKLHNDKIEARILGSEPSDEALRFGSETVGSMLDKFPGKDDPALKEQFADLKDTVQNIAAFAFAAGQIVPRAQQAATYVRNTNADCKTSGATIDFKMSGGK